MRIVTIAALVLAVAIGCGGAEPRVEPEPDPVYRLSVGPLNDPTVQSAGRAEIWVAPEPGLVRSEFEADAGLRRTAILVPGSRVIHYTDSRPTVRTGSDAFLGDASELDVLGAVRARGDLVPGDELTVEGPGRPFTLRVEDRLALADAAHLFAVPEDADLERELAPGEPSAVPGAYWLGERFGRREAVTAVELLGGETGRVHITFYELPAANGRTSAYPGTDPPRGELQLVSRPVDDPLARTTIARLEDASRVAVRLASGERAELFVGPGPERSYHVVTDGAFVEFGDLPRAEAIRIARALRRL